MGKKYFDITRTLGKDTLTYPGDVSFHATHHREGNISASELFLSSHSGTHLDAPKHFFPDADSLDQIDIKNFFMTALVIDCGHVKIINNIFLKNHQSYIDEVEAVLFKTNNSNFNRDAFAENFTALNEDGAKYLDNFNLKLVGIDYLSIEGHKNQPFPVHQHLLGNGIMILEDIRLQHINPGNYELVVLPLKWNQSDGAPSRAVLIQA